MAADAFLRERSSAHPDNLRKRSEYYGRLARAARDPGIRDLYQQMSDLIAERAELARRRQALLDQAPPGRS